MTGDPLSGSRIPVFVSGKVSGFTSHGSFVPMGAEGHFTLDFQMPGRGCYGVVARDARMDPPVRPGDMVIVCPDVELRPGIPAVAKIKGEPKVVLGNYHSVGTNLLRLVPSNERHDPVEVTFDEIQWIHPMVITVPGAEFRHGQRRNRKRPPADA